MSSIKMGKNDLWISATTNILGGTLLTMDKDFNHLAEVFFKLKFIPQKIN